jgi:TetR/AcrR family transcriptional regulator
MNVDRGRIGPSGDAPSRRAGRPAQPTGIPDEAEILARGLGAFAELGYQDASVRELARRLGVSHNFINDRYGSKDAFWHAVMARSLAAKVNLLREILTLPGEDDLARLRTLLHAFHQANLAEPDLARVMQYEASRGGSRLDYVFHQYVAPVRDAVAPIVQRLVDQGRVRPIPLDVIVYAVLAMTSIHAELPLATLLGDSFAVDASGFVTGLSDILLDGFVVDPPG